MNKDKNPIPFFALEGVIWTNLKPEWARNSANCIGYHYKNILFPDTYYFQLKISSSITSLSQITSVDLRNVSDNAIVAHTFQTRIYSDEDGEKYLLIETELDSGLIDGQYYIGVITELGNYYSETFCIKNIIYTRVGLVWASTNRVGAMMYADGFKHKLTFDAKIVPLPTEIQEDTLEDGFGNETPTLQRLIQPYVFSCVVPNYIAEAISALPLHDQFKVINYWTGESGTEEFDEDITDMEVTVTPEEDSCFSLLQVQYSVQTVIKTSCRDAIDEVVPFNSAPFAYIIWDDTQTSEDRTCSVDLTCDETILIEQLYDFEGNLDYSEWEYSTDGGDNWISAGVAVGDTKTFTEVAAAIYWYRLKAVDTAGAIGYSNILVYSLFDLSGSAYIVDQGTETNDCGLGTPTHIERGGRRKFDIIGNNSQTVKVRRKVLYNISYSFIFTIVERNTETVLYTFNGNSSNSAVGTFDDTTLDLDGTGLGEFYIQICLSPDPNNFLGAKTEMAIILFENDNVTLSDQQVSVIGQIRR